jgi:hypothetical protein
MMVRQRLFASTRQATGDPSRHYAYVIDSSTGRTIAACQHRHVSQLRQGGKNGEYYAMQCAERMLRKLNAAHVSKVGEQT